METPEAEEEGAMTDTPRPPRWQRPRVYRRSVTMLRWGMAYAARYGTPFYGWQAPGGVLHLFPRLPDGWAEPYWVMPPPPERSRLEWNEPTLALVPDTEAP